MILLGTENYSTKNSLSSPAELKEMHGENDFFRMIENKKSKVFDSTIYRNTKCYKAVQSTIARETKTKLSSIVSD